MRSRRAKTEDSGAGTAPGADDLEDLDGAVRRHDPDRWLASRFIADPDDRADVIALYAFNHELARVAGAVSNPIMGEIRLTWWSEALDEIYAGKPVRRHPVTEALAAAIRRRGLPRDPFDAMIEARFPELDGAPPDRLSTDPPLVTLAARVLGVEDPALLAVAQGRLEEARTLTAKAFPLVAHLALRDRGDASAFARRLRITWAVLTGRL